MEDNLQKIHNQSITSQNDMCLSHNPDLFSYVTKIAAVLNLQKCYYSSN